MKSIIKYLSHADFVRVKQWQIIEAVNGTYTEQLRQLQENADLNAVIYGKIPCIYDDVYKFKKKWAFPAYASKCLCVDTDTGEILDPL